MLLLLCTRTRTHTHSPLSTSMQEAEPSNGSGVPLLQSILQCTIEPRQPAGLVPASWPVSTSLTPKSAGKVMPCAWRHTSEILALEAKQGRHSHSDMQLGDVGPRHCQSNVMALERLVGAARASDGHKTDFSQNLKLFWATFDIGFAQPPRAPPPRRENHFCSLT